MNPNCAEEVRVNNDHAVRCSIVSKPVNVLEYVKSISALIGASHILAVFEESDFIKVFFDDKRYVDTLIKSCLHVMGHHIRVDYVTPPGTKLMLSNVDPVISNYDIMRLLSVYGTIVSPVICPPISDDIELCHIGYGVRYVYMNIVECLPEKLEFKYGDNLSYIKICVVNASDPPVLLSIKMDDVEENQDIASNSSVISQDTVVGPPNIINLCPMPEDANPVLVSVQSVTENNSEEKLNSSSSKISPLRVSLNGLPNVNNNEESVGKKRRGRPPLINKRKINSVMTTATSQAAKKIKKTAKHRWIRRHYRKGRCGRKPSIKPITIVKRTYHERSDSSSSCNSLPNIAKLIAENEIPKHATNDKILEEKKLLEYIEEVKHHRAPLELAKKYIGDDCNLNKINKFIEQLQEYKKINENFSLKARIWRLLKSLNDAVSNEPIQSSG